MLTLEQFRSLEVGDLIETSPLLGGLLDDPVILLTDKRVEKPDRLEFVVTYLGITLGRWTCTHKNGELVWITP